MNKMGFGFLRIPMDGGEVDYEKLNPLVDLALERGCVYFDTAFAYLKGKSEEAIRKSLVERHDRGSFRIIDKLPGYKVKAPEDCRKLFDIQLERCGVDFFDVYMLHWLNEKNYEPAEQFQQFAFLQELKQSGEAKRIGFSFHDTPAVLDRILTEHPEIDVVLLQINYLDWDSATIQSRRCYEVARKHGKTVFVMEPLKGGSLVQLPEQAQALLSGTPASYGLRFAQSLDGVEVVLSGMNDRVQLEENLKEVDPITPEEQELLRRVVEELNKSIAVSCSGCGYCLSHCPKGIRIPEYFKIYNEYARNSKEGWKSQPAYRELMASIPATDCIACGSCEAHCPQKLPIIEQLKELVGALN